MANSAFRLGGVAVPVAPESAPRAHVARSECALSIVAVGTPVRVVDLALEDDLGEWLRAVGICEGECLTVLRRAAFGGPVHVRTRSGGEFALNRSLAQSIVVSVLTREDQDAPDDA